MPRHNPITSLAEIRQANLVDLGKLVAHDAHRLQMIARWLHKADEAECNEDMSDERRAMHERHMDEHESEAIRLASDHGLLVYRQYDPRGWPLYLYRASDLGGRDIDTCYSNVAFGVCPR